MRRGLAIIMTHSRDITVFYTKQKVIFEIPLYFEPSIKLDKVSLEDGLLVIETLKRVEQTPQHLEGADSLRLATRDDPKIQ